MHGWWMVVFGMNVILFHWRKKSHTETRNKYLTGVTQETLSLRAPELTCFPPVCQNATEWLSCTLVTWPVQVYTDTMQSVRGQGQTLPTALPRSHTRGNIQFRWNLALLAIALWPAGEFFANHKLPLTATVADPCLSWMSNPPLPLALNRDKISRNVMDDADFRNVWDSCQQTKEKHRAATSTLKAQARWHASGIWLSEGPLINSLHSPDWWNVAGSM